MSAETRSALLEEYLGRVRSHLPLRRGADILRELESSIRDRVDDMAAAEERAPDEDLVRRALAEIGEPERVAVAYASRGALVAPEEFRAFLASTAVVFAIHLALIGVATTLGKPLQFGPAAVAPVGPHGFLSTAASVVHALLLDLGIMVIAFAAKGVVRAPLTRVARTNRVDTSARTCLGRIVLTLLVALALTAFRDRVFVVVTGGETHPLFTEWFAANAPLVVGVLAFSVVSDALYLALGERRLTLAVDALHGVAGIACMLFLLRGEPVLAVPGLEQLAHAHEPVNDFLARLSQLVLGFIALVLTVKTVRRLLRFAQA